MRIAIVGPIATEDVAHLLGNAAYGAPAGYTGAPILATLIESLIDRGHEVIGITTDATLSIDGSAVKARGALLQMVYCPQRRRSFSPEGGHIGRAADAFRLERRFLVDAIRDAQPDIVHAHWLYEFAWAAQDAGVPHVLTAHDSPAQILKYSPTLYRTARYFMARRVAVRASHLTTVSPYMQHELAKLTRAKVDVVPNPLPKQLMSMGMIQRDLTRRTAATDGGRLAMVFNGWSSWKNGEVGLQAFALIRQTLPQAQLYLFGQGGGEGEEAAKCAATCGLTAGISFLGRLPHRQLLQKLSACDLLLHPALEESFGAVLIEAMSLGVPVIAGQASGAVPWVVGKGGRLVNVHSANAIAQAALDLLRDPNELMAVGDLAKADTLARFSPVVIAAAYEEHYSRAIGTGHA